MIMKKIFVAMLSVLSLAACTSEDQKNQPVVGEWSIESAMDKGTETGDSHAFITFTEDGHVNGNASVNTFFGEYQVKGDSLFFSHMGMTRMYGTSMDVEDAIVEALNSAVIINVVEDRAYILNAQKDTVMTLIKDEL